MDGKNFFENTTKEISHSAFFSWLFEMMRENENTEKYGLKLLDAFFDGELREGEIGLEDLVVEKEYKFVERRADIYLKFPYQDTTKYLIIENKIESHSGDKLIEYQGELEEDEDADINNEDIKTVLLTTNYTVKQKPENVKLVGLSDLNDIFPSKLDEDVKGPNWLLEQYFLWLDSRFKSFSRLEPTNLDGWKELHGSWSSDNWWKFRILQWRYILEIFDIDPLECIEIPYLSEESNLPAILLGTNKGWPWIQLSVTRRGTGSTDGFGLGKLFYRIDLRKANGDRYPYFEIRHYTYEGSDMEKGQKEEIGEKLRRSFVEAVREVGLDESTQFDSDPPYSSFKYRETSICGFEFRKLNKEAYTPDELHKRIPELHRKFIGKLKEIPISEIPEDYQEDWGVWMDDLREFREYELR